MFRLFDGISVGLRVPLYTLGTDSTEGRPWLRTPRTHTPCPIRIWRDGVDLTMVTDLYYKTCVLVPGMYQGGPLQRDQRLGVRRYPRIPGGPAVNPNASSMRYAPPGRLDLPETPQRSIG